MANFPQGMGELYEHLGGLVHPSQTVPVEDGQMPIASTLEKEADGEIVNPAEPTGFKVGKLIREIWIYAFIFILALVFYFGVMTNSLTGFKNTVMSWLPGGTKTTQQQTAQLAATQSKAPQLTLAQQAAYNAWIRSYFYDVSDPSITDPNNDISGNGLTNYQKFLLGLNPRSQATLTGMNMTDSQALIAGVNPLTGGPVTDQQKTLIASSIDLEEVSNKLTMAAMQHSVPQVAGATTGSAGSVATGSTGSTTPLRSDATIDQTQNGELDIPSLGITVPLIWTQSTGDLLKDLPNGVVHYPGTALPGQIGTSYISGHSSNYSWIKGNYNKVFATLNNLKQYDSFVIKVKDTSGKTVTYHYAVDDKAIFNANDQQQFANVGKSTVALSTCWPVGTSQNRLVVFGELTQIEQ